MYTTIHVSFFIIEIEEKSLLMRIPVFDFQIGYILAIRLPERMKQTEDYYIEGLEFMVL